MSVEGALRRGLAGGLVALTLCLPAAAQVSATKGAPTPSPAPAAEQPAGEAIQNRPAIVAQKAPSGLVVSKGSGGPAALDYAAWEKAADRAETVLSDPAVTDRALRASAHYRLLKFRLPPSHG